MEYMDAQQAAEAAKGLTFETVWASLVENGKRIDQMREYQQESLKQLKESQQETFKQIKESQQETEKLVNALSKNIGGLGNSLGRFMEEMFSAELYKKFRNIGYTFTKQSENVKINVDDQLAAEIDLFMENGDYVMLVEIKTDLSIKDVDRHIERMVIIRDYMDIRGDARKIVGAVAGGSVMKNVQDYAHEKGLYVVVQSGEAVEIAIVPKNFQPREW